MDHMEDKFCFNYGISLSHSSNYYPRGNGIVELKNKNVMTIIKNIVGDNKIIGIIRLGTHYACIR